MTIIFTKLSGLHKPIAILLSYFKQEVYYVDLSHKGSISTYADKLQDRNIRPLPIESLKNISDTTLCESNDWEYGGLNHLVDKALPESIVILQTEFYINVSQLVKKLRLIFKTQLPLKNIGRAVIYSKENSSNNHLIVCNNLLETILPIKEPNIKKIFIPSFGFILSLVQNLKVKFKPPYFSAFKKNKFVSYNTRDDEVVYVTHKGLSFHNLFKKNLFYGNGLLEKKKLLHLSYSGQCHNPEELRWIYITNNIKWNSINIFLFFKSFVKSIAKIRTKEQLLGSLFLSLNYLKYSNYRAQAKHLNNLKFALIDYEILCPKQLLLAFESLSVKTIAVQERYLRMYYQSTGVFLDYYLCASDFSERVLKQNSSYIIEKYLPIGQYRSDSLSDNNIKDLPSEVHEAKILGKKVVVALTYNVHNYSHLSCVDPLLSWSSHISFLEDMISLANDLDNSFLIIRCMDIDWMELSIFEDVIERISSKENIVISTEYSKDLQSYLLCSFADLVIAKHTSLGDECLSRNIPVLFYDYTHNRNSLFSFICNYKDSGIMCHGYNDILYKSRAVLNKEFDTNIFNEMYGDYNTGNVRERIRLELSNILNYG